MGLCLVDGDILALCSASRLKWAKANDARFTRYAMKLQNEPVILYRRELPRRYRLL